MHLRPVAAQAGQRAGIALALGGFQLRLIAVAEPELGLQVGRLAQRRGVGDFLDDPARALEPLAGIGNGGPHFRHGIEAVRVETHRDALRHRRAFQRRRHPPGIARILARHRGERDPDIADGARQRAGDGADLRADRPLRQRRVERRNAAHGRPQAMHAAGISRIADRSRDISAMGDVPDAGGNRSPCPAGRAAGRDAGIARVLGVAMNEVGGEPAIGERRALVRPRMTAPDLRRLSITGLLLLAMASRCSFNPLVVAKPSWSILTFTVTGTPPAGPDLRRARSRHRWRTPGQDVSRPVVDDGVDLGVDRVQPCQRRGRRLLGRDFLRPDQGSHFGGRQAPESCMKNSLNWSPL